MLSFKTDGRSIRVVIRTVLIVLPFQHIDVLFKSASFSLNCLKTSGRLKLSNQRYLNTDHRFHELFESCQIHVNVLIRANHAYR